jgi:urease accessory protein
VINKIDIAQYVRTDLEIMERDAHAVRDGKPVVLTNSLDGTGLQELFDRILAHWAATQRELVA